MTDATLNKHLKVVTLVTLATAAQYALALMGAAL